MKYQLPHPNRNKCLLPRHRHLFWCMSCDMCLVGRGQYMKLFPNEVAVGPLE